MFKLPGAPAPAADRLERDVPTYRLYGEALDGIGAEFLHCESIAFRSGLHNWRIRPHRHRDLHHVFYFREGHGTVALDHAVVTFEPPCLLSIPPLTVHGFDYDMVTDGWVVTLPVATVDRMIALAPGIKEHLEAPLLIPLADETHGVVAPLFERIAAEFTGNEPGRLVTLQALVALVFVEVARAGISSYDRRLTVADSGAERIREFHKLIEARFRTHAPVSVYARALGITATQLNRTCRAVVGRSALEMIHERIVLEAKRNLIFTSMTVAEVGYSLGFEDPSYFSRFFQHRVGTTPSAFQRDARIGRNTGRPMLRAAE